MLTLPRVSCTYRTISPIGCSASGAYVPGPDEQQVAHNENTKVSWRLSFLKCETVYSETDVPAFLRNLLPPTSGYYEESTPRVHMSQTTATFTDTTTTMTHRTVQPVTTSCKVLVVENTAMSPLATRKFINYTADEDKNWTTFIFSTILLSFIFLQTCLRISWWVEITFQTTIPSLFHTTLMIT
jgi:hypothetical protein